MKIPNEDLKKMDKEKCVIILSEGEKQAQKLAIMHSNRLFDLILFRYL